MRILLFTHEQDIDGLGCAVLASKANLDYDLVLCKTFELDNKIMEHINDQSIYAYDRIIVTDLCPKEDTLEILNNDNLLKNKVQVLDHHKTALSANKYVFVKVVSEDNNKSESGTSLFYNYLVEHELLEPSDLLSEFVELTRQYDTWDWYDNKNYLARKLHIIFETKGINYYLKMMERIINNNSQVVLSDEEENIVKEFDKKLLEEIDKMLEDMKVLDLDIDSVKYRIGYIKSLYKYRNDISDVIKNNNIFDIDVVGMIMGDRDSVSYRAIKDVDVSLSAKHFGGSGHKSSASHPKDNEGFQRVLRKLYN